MPESEFINFVDDVETRKEIKPVWNVAVIDDEPDVITATKIALSNYMFENNGLAFHCATNVKDAKALFEEHDISVAFVDVVMEEEDSGLKLV